MVGVEYSTNINWHKFPLNLVTVPFVEVDGLVYPTWLCSVAHLLSTFIKLNYIFKIKSHSPKQK
jgi:hypothetical protein